MAEKNHTKEQYKRTVQKNGETKLPLPEGEG
jgi:hypothetical protein